MSDEQQAAIEEEGPGNGTPRACVLIHGPKATYAWIPKPDITAAELAEAVGFLQMGQLVALQAVLFQATGGKVQVRLVPPPLLDMVFRQFPDTVKRHFAVKPTSTLVVPGGG